MVVSSGECKATQLAPMFSAKAKSDRRMQPLHNIQTVLVTAADAEKRIGYEYTDLVHRQIRKHTQCECT